MDSSALSGMGRCLEGTLETPTSIAHCDLANFTGLPKKALYQAESGSQKFKTVLSPILQTSWHFMTCPAENECRNDHHNCDPVTQKCINTADGYDCLCNEGYFENNSTGDSKTGDPKKRKCEPICSQGCQNGDCVAPEKCKCHFGFVGESCDVECLCNGHSECESTTQRDKCLDCKNNTMGEQCQFCK